MTTTPPFGKTRGKPEIAATVSVAFNTWGIQGGIRQTPRKDRPNGRINAVRVYARPQFFLAR